MDFRDILLFTIGFLIFAWACVSAIRTFMLPGTTAPGIGKLVFRGIQWIFLLAGTLLPSDNARSALFSVYGPVALLGLYITLIAANGIGFAFMFAALGERTVQEALIASGSSLSTLGFADFKRVSDTALSVVEAMGTTTISALLIGYLPTIFSNYLSATQAVHDLEAQIENPDCGPNIIVSLSKPGATSSLDDFWKSWTGWFTKLAVSHGSLVGNLFLRSPQTSRTWVQVSSSVLDSAALWQTAVDAPSSPAAEACLRAGISGLTRAVQLISFEPHPKVGNAEQHVGVTRQQFDIACDRMAAGGLAVRQDRDTAWTAFVQVRAQYGAQLHALARVKQSPLIEIDCVTQTSVSPLHLPWRGKRHLPNPGETHHGTKIR